MTCEHEVEGVDCSSWFREITSVHSVLFIESKKQQNTVLYGFMQARMRKAVFSYVALAAQRVFRSASGIRASLDVFSL